MYKGRNMKPSLLAVYAHPDDEAFGTGGTLATYAAQGIPVTVVSATRGEAGEIADPTLAKPDTLGTVRENELRCAARILGIEEPIFLDYRDSGMAGTPENEHPEAFIQIPTEEVVRRLVGIIRRIQPMVVVTFEPNGGYGHPDHIAIHRHTVEAFRAAADPACFPEQGEAWQAHRLFYTAIPRSFFREMRQRLEALGVDTSDFERFEQAGAGWPDEDVHVRLDVSTQIDAKWAAMQCHRTQFGSDSLFRRLPEDMGRQIMSHEHFALAWPEDVPPGRLAGLFDGLLE
jgi:N-acetyl-1-D-myo-inositol-2-amino-2-deoxy-alpha-D-glucopyranoside deacetylase